MGAAASIAGVGLSAAGDVASGFAKQEELEVKAENYLLEGKAKATNYLLESEGRAINSLAEGRTKGANYRFDADTRAQNAIYEGQSKKVSFGMEASRAEREADRAERAADFGRLNASLADAGMREEFERTIGNIRTIRAAGGIDATSPTSAAVIGREEKVAERQRQASLLSINSQIKEDEAAALYLRKSAEFSLMQGQSAEDIARFNANTARVVGGYNATVAEEMGEFNADLARKFGTYNAAVTERYAARNAEAARKSGRSSVRFGFLKGAATVLGGLGQMGTGGSKAA